MWDQNDKNEFDVLMRRGQGQIVTGDGLSEWIRKLCLDPGNTTFLEIGTWNGLGSTKVFVESLKQRSDFQFWSLECNREKSALAQGLYSNITGVHILNETVCGGEKQPDDFFDVFPECKDNATFQYWNEVDMENMKECPLFLDRPELPEVFDVILLDGGEFTTYYEFQKLRDRCRYLLLDDTNVSKCKKIVEEISPTWKILEKGPTRNGYVVAAR
jgi:hypothetical protein